MNKKKLFKNKYDFLITKRDYELEYGIKYGLDFNNCYPCEILPDYIKEPKHTLAKQLIYDYKKAFCNSKKMAND